MNQTDFQPIFQPRSVAVIGASGDPTKFGGRTYLMLKDRTVNEKIYAVNPKMPEIDGQQAYANIKDIAGDVDFAIITVPAPFVVQAIQDCADKGVQTVEIFSAGFNETGEKDGVLREKQIVEIAKTTGMRIVGPNCFGVYSPESPLTIIPGPDYPKEVGPVGIFAQSGGFTGVLTRKVLELGIGINKAVSYGNACDLNEADFISFFRDDERTKVVAGYIEGIKDGQRFLELVKETSLKKPVIIWKGGLSEQGGRAVASHTASLAGSRDVWNGVFQQTGAVPATGLNEIVDLIIGFTHIPDFKAANMSVVGGGGAITVAAADALDEQGLAIQVFSEDTQAAIRKYLPPYGNSVKNPVDIGAPIFIPEVFGPILDIISASNKVDAVVVEHIIHRQLGQFDERVGNLIPDASSKSGKPFIVTMPQTTAESGAVEAEKIRRLFREHYLSRSIPVFDSLEQAANVLGKIKKYNHFRVSQTS